MWSAALAEEGCIVLFEYLHKVVNIAVVNVFEFAWIGHLTHLSDFSPFLMLQ